MMRHGMYSDAMNIASNITVPEFREIMTRMVQATYAVRFQTSITGKPDDALLKLEKFEFALNHLPKQAKWNIPMLAVQRSCQPILLLKGEGLAKQYPNDALVRYKVGLWQLGARNYKDAVTHLRASVELQLLPESLRGLALKNLGLALIGLGNLAEAERSLRVALDQSTPDFQAYCTLSDVYKRIGRIEDAAHAEENCRHYFPKKGLWQ